MVSGNSSDVIYKEVVIIGNGPSGIALSYMLSGNLPYLTSDSHPDEMLSARLNPAVGQCLVKQDLRHLAAGLEGRSTNPVSLLLDSLQHPCADIGLEMEPLIEFRRLGMAIDHVVLGKGPPGGSWHQMDPYVLTLSLGSWMALPGLPFHSRDSGEKRAFACNVANYYVQYVKEMELSANFVNNAAVTAVKPVENEKRRVNFSATIEIDPVERLTNNPETVQRFKDPAMEVETSSEHKCMLSNAFNYVLSRGNRRGKGRCCKRPREHALCRDQSPTRKIRDVGTQTRSDRTRSISLSCDSVLSDSLNSVRMSRSMDLSSARVPFRINYCDPDKKGNWVVETHNVESGETTTYSCKYLVMANGASDLPNRLDFARGRKDPEWLFHDLRTLEFHLDQHMKGRNGEDVDPVLIVGAGLSAADAVVATRGRNVPVLHVFRNKSADLNKQLPENMYPEYHKVHQMMQDGGSTYPFYSAYPEYSLTSVDEASRQVTLTSKTGDDLKFHVSFVAVLIGARPDLTFLPRGSNLGVRKDLPVDCKTNTLDINKVTHQVEGYPNLFAVGPLAGDNFVRFIPGGALAVVSELYRRNNYVGYV